MMNRLLNWLKDLQKRNEEKQYSKSQIRVLSIFCKIFLFLKQTRILLELKNVMVIAYISHKFSVNIFGKDTWISLFWNTFSNVSSTNTKKIVRINFSVCAQEPLVILLWKVYGFITLRPKHFIWMKKKLKKLFCLKSYEAIKKSGTITIWLIAK